MEAEQEEEPIGLPISRRRRRGLVARLLHDLDARRKAFVYLLTQRE